MSDKEPPVAQKIQHVTRVLNADISDDYFWLRDPSWPKVTDSKILDYLNKENHYSSLFFDAHKDKVNSIFEELKGRIKLVDNSVYTKKDNFYYYSRTQEDAEYPIYCRKEGGIETPEQIVLDVNKLAKDKKFTKISGLSMSPSHSLAAYSADFAGDEKYTIYIKNLDNGTYIEDKIESTIGPIVWHEDESGFFYTPVNNQWRHDRVMFHKLGTSPQRDKLIFQESDVLNQVSISKSSSKKYFFIESSGHDSSEIYYFTMEDQKFTPIKLLPRRDGVFYNIDHSGDYFYIHTNDTSSNFRIARIPVNNPSIDSMEQYVLADSRSYLSDCSLTKNYLIMNYKINGLPQIFVTRLADDESKSISFPEEAYVASGYSTNFDEDDIRINYSSLKRPDVVYSYKYGATNLDVLKTQEIPSGFDPDLYELKRVWADSNGTKIPMTIFYRKDQRKNDYSNPVYLYGYGSYGISIPPSFRNSAISLVDRGFIYAIAHIRGGDDLGFEWYESAKFLNKKHTFEDFLACMDFLVDNKYTKKGDITIAGGSAGGMLIGWTLNNAPTYLKSAVAHVPFVDVLNTMLDETLPLTPGEYKEWGNPNEAGYFDYIKSYSPYDNVTDKNYPSILITAGLSDPRVTYWEAAKWTAKLRAHNKGSNPIYLKVNMDAGHQGASGRFDYLKEVAEEFVFVLDTHGK